MTPEGGSFTLGTTDKHVVTRILESIQAGDVHASEELLPLVYDELRRLAHHRMAHERAGMTLQPTALVHEAYLRLVGDQTPHWDNAGHFFAAAAEAMRRIMIERARRARTEKHGGGHRRVTLPDVPSDPVEVDVLALDEALQRLERRDEDMARVVKLRFFAGLTTIEAARALGVSKRTVIRHWVAARTWLWREMNGESKDGRVEPDGA